MCGKRASLRNLGKPDITGVSEPVLAVTKSGPQTGSACQTKDDSNTYFAISCQELPTSACALQIRQRNEVRTALTEKSPRHKPGQQPPLSMRRQLMTYLNKTSSSSALHGVRTMLGSRTLKYRSRHCLVLRPGILALTMRQSADAISSQEWSASRLLIIFVSCASSCSINEGVRSDRRVVLD